MKGILRATKTLITYDLLDNDVSASEIASNSNFLDSVLYLGKYPFDLPNTTLACTLGDVSAAKAEFERAFRETDSDSTISRLFVVKVENESCIIENEY